MRKQLEPDWETAEKMYPLVRALIEEYAQYCAQNGDEEMIQYKILENKLSEMTGKDISQFHLWEWWEEEGSLVLSFKISLPEPNIVPDISKEELLEIVKRLKADVLPVNENSFKDDFIYHIGEYYHKLLKLNFKKYKHEYFNRQKGKDGRYFEYNAEEIVEMLWE